MLLENFGSLNHFINTISFLFVKKMMHYFIKFIRIRFKNKIFSCKF